MFEASFQTWSNFEVGVCWEIQVIGVPLGIPGPQPVLVESSSHSLPPLLFSLYPALFPSNLLLSCLQNRLFCHMLLSWPTMPSQSPNNQNKWQWIEISEAKINLYYLISCLMYFFHNKGKMTNTVTFLTPIDWFILSNVITLWKSPGFSAEINF